MPRAVAGREDLLREFALWIVVGAGLLLAALGGRPPTPRDVGSRSELFSAARALPDVRAIGRTPHPTGSEAIEDVRAYVLARLQAVGVPAGIHTGSAAASPPGARQILTAADVQNVVGVLPGRDRARPAVLVMAHYDSVANSPGAADDAAGVAALIEIARSLAADARAHGPAARDVIFLATDAEEVELLGAHAFFDTDPFARRVGVAINLEARGGGGRAAMFQTGPRDGEAIRLFARRAERPYANGFTGFVASVLPNDTDFSVARAHGVDGYNFAFIDEELVYHSPVANPAHLDPRSLQNLGGEALPLVRALAAAPALPARSPDWAYADLFGRSVLGYPAAVGGWLVLLAASALAGFAAWRAHARRLVDIRGAAAGAFATVFSILAAALVLHLAGRALAGDASRLYRLLIHPTALVAGCALLGSGVGLAAWTGAAWAGAARSGRRTAAGVAALAAGLAGSAFGGFDAVGLGLGAVTAAVATVALGRAPSAWDAWFGGLGVVAVLAVLVQLAAAPAAPVLAWPLALASLGAVAVFGFDRPRTGLALTAALAVIVVALVAEWSHGVFSALGASTPEALAVMAAPSAAILAPFVRLWAGRKSSALVAVAIGALGAATLVGVSTASGSPDRPRMTEAFYLSRPAEARAWRIAPGVELDDWTRRLLNAGGARPVRTTLDDDGPSGARPVWAAPAPSRPLSGPEITTTRDEGRLVITVRPTRKVRAIVVALAPGAGPKAGLADPRLDARPVAWPLARDRRAVALYAAPPPEGFTLSFAAAPHGSLSIVATTIADGWPAGLAPPRPPPGLAAWHGSDTTRVQTAAEVRW